VASDAETVRLVAGLDASRRVGWARFYEAEQAAVLVTGYLLAMTRMLKDGNTREARQSVLRCMAKLQSSEYGRSLMERTLDENAYLREWLEEGLKP
jgi:hypothetical protein